MEGGCNCGGIRFTVRTSPLAIYICHCHLCQKRTGSAFSMSMVLAENALKISKTDLRSDHRTLPDGTQNVSWTCNVCFSRIYTHKIGSKTINLRVGTLDQTENLKPVAQFWTDSAQRWAVVTGILTYPAQPDDYGPVVRAWAALVEGRY
jgi:hypothetical protein